MKLKREISLFKTRADAYLFNGGNLTDLYAAINKWWKEKRNVLNKYQSEYENSKGCFWEKNLAQICYSVN